VLCTFPSKFIVHDYYNSVLSSTPKKVMGKLQHVQNAAPRLVTGTGKYKRGLSQLMHVDLHWLVIPQQVQYKLAVTVHRCLLHQAPWYLADYCVPVSEVPGRQHLRSARCHKLSVLRVCHSTFWTRSFYVADHQSGIHYLIICSINELHRVRKKGATLFLPVTLQNANRFSNLFYHHALQ